MRKLPELPPLGALRNRDGAWTDWSLGLTKRVEQRYREIAAEGFRGVSTSSGTAPGLFCLRPTGVDMKPVRSAIQEYLGSLTAREEANGRFPMEHESWRQWMNGARYFLRHGLCLEDLTMDKRIHALNVIRASLSGGGYSQVLDMMHLNRTVGELRDELEMLNEWVYWFSVYGSPGADGVWGWQLDGHHVNVNCVFIGDQMVLTPTFLGAEPVFAAQGKYAGARVFESEEQIGFELFSSLRVEQQSAARIGDELPPDLFTGAYRDNFELNYEGIRIGDVEPAQRKLATRLISLYVNRAAGGHAATKLREVSDHLPDTYFAWIGADEPGGVFYYRVHSPVILVEFEHQAGQMFDGKAPTRNHVHTVVRTPNGNDYGVDLLRQHHEHHHHAA